MIASELIKSQESLRGKSAQEIICWAADAFGPKLAFASSLGVVDQVVTHMLSLLASPVQIFTLDTGRLFEQTYQLIEDTEARYNLKIQVLSPDTLELETMVQERGINLFYKSVENRKLCCSVRKTHPLKRALSGASAWICGLRRDQSVTRQELQAIEWDEQNDLPKISPLWNWKESDVWDFVKAQSIPYNPLHDKGFLSIGCSSCTRAVLPGEDIRAGRWWWESPEHKECGLHLRNGKLVRTQ